MDTDTMIGVGAVGEDVRVVQQTLREAGFDIRADGIFGSRTARALADFQCRHLLEPSGAVNEATLDALGLIGRLDDHGRGLPLDLPAAMSRLRTELRRPVHHSDDEAIHERRWALRRLLARVSPVDAAELGPRLGESSGGDELSRLFHRRLATVVRQEMLRILARSAARAVPVGPDAGPVVDGPTQPDPGASPTVDTAGPPELILPRNPLTPSELHRFDAAAAAFLPLLQGESGWETRIRCWIGTLLDDGDDRVIPWPKICPSRTGALGAAFLVGPCDISRGMPVDQFKLQDAVRDVGDVERVGRELGFMEHYRTQLVLTHDITPPELWAHALQLSHDDIVNAVNKLFWWANNPMGGSSMMHVSYRAIKDWLFHRQEDPHSIYSCP